MKDKEDKLKETLVISSSLFYKKIQNISYLGKRASEVCEELTKFSEGIENIIKSIEEVGLQASKAFKKIPEELSYSQREYLFEEGWYLSEDIPVNHPRLIKDLIYKNNYKKLEKLLINYSKSKIPEIREKVGKYFPKRIKIINDALNAHEKNIYTLSIPILLIQAEGICKEIIDVTPFINVKSRKKYLKMQEKINEKINKLEINGISVRVDSITDILLKYLLSETDINRSMKSIIRKKKNDKKYNPLNRDYILHGDDFKYANKTNSYKVISFLNYIIDLKDIFENMENIKSDLVTEDGSSCGQA